MSVIRHNFDSENRTTARRLRTLLKLNALHEANIRANPVPYLERASERIFQLEKILFEAVEAATSPSEPSGSARDDQREQGGIPALPGVPCDHRERIGATGCG
jgi:hypothetical protein